MECNDAKISNHALKNSHSYEIGRWEGKKSLLTKANNNNQVIGK